MVIQRWQSVLLLIAAALMACFTFLSLGQVTTPDYTFNFTTLGFISEGIPTDGETTVTLNTWYLFMLSLLSFIVPIIDIFLFKNLRLQKTVCLIAILIVIATGSVAGCEGFTAISDGEIGWSTVILCPFIAIVALILAYNRISSDQNKLRNEDRLR